MPAVIALLGPTNTGKTYHAVERLLAHRTGMIGFPLRLLARQNYDRLVQLRGADAVALITGEERIVPAAPRYFVCTVEAMPLDRRVELLAVDEVQLAAARARGGGRGPARRRPRAGPRLHRPAAAGPGHGRDDVPGRGDHQAPPAPARAGGLLHHARAALHPDLRRAQEAGPAAAAQRDRGLLAGRPLRGGGARADRSGGGGR